VHEGEARLCGVGWDREGSATVYEGEARLCGVGWEREGSVTVQQSEACLCGVGWEREGSATVQQSEVGLCGVGPRAISDSYITSSPSPSLQESESDSAPLTLIPIAARMALSCILLSLSIASRILHAV